MSDAPRPWMNKVVPIESIDAGSEVDSQEVRALCDEAAEYLKGLSWRGGIEERFPGIGVPGLLGVFLFRIAPARSDVDPWVWVITGDLPPASITTENAPNPACALDAYVGAMESWVRAVREGRSVNDEIPVSAPPTAPYADALESRLKILDQHVLPRYRIDLTEGGWTS